jgi:hypothetical protein
MVAPATSGSYTYTQTASDLISAALRICSVIADEEIPEPSQAQNTLLALNGMVKGWQASGLHVWCEEECILFLNANQTVYRLGSGSTDHACLFDALTQTSLTATAAGGSSSVQVSSASGINAGDQFGVQLDSGINFWTTVSVPPVGTTVTLASPLSGQATAGAICFDYGVPLMRPLRAPQARRYLYSSRQETPMITMSRFDYDYLPNKTTTGIPTNFFYDPQTGNGPYTQPLSKFNVWPAPADFTSGIRFIGQRPLQDIASITQMPDFPVEWLSAIKWNLALEVAPEFSLPLDQFALIEKRANYWLDLAKRWDKEPESVLFGVAFQPGYRR